MLKIKSSRREEKEFQREFPFQLGLIVDKPKHGFGSCNDSDTVVRSKLICKKHCVS